MYPYPSRHVYDRQSQVDIMSPDLDKFPNFCKATVHEAIIGPGDILFIPAFWWHFVVSDNTTTTENDLDITISVRFSFYRAETKGLNWANKILSMRTIERIVAEKLGEQAAIQFFVNASKGILDESTWRQKNLEGEIVEVLKKCGVVEREENVKGYLAEMVGGRFSHLEES